MLAVLLALPQQTAPAPAAPPGMVWIASGEFSMGCDASGARADERPVHRVRVHGFWIDRTEVTNAAFQRFVEETRYVTTAERPLDAHELARQLAPGTPLPGAAELAPGALVFRCPERAVPLDDPSGWWVWTPGASWRHPEGPASSIAARLDHPVVQVSHADALAYCRWAGKRLPSEAEWEFAARGGKERAPFSWGDAPPTATSANLWQGEFPRTNRAEDGFASSAPVGSFPANGYGLVDMAGNVWEWCADWYRPDAYELAQRAAHDGVCLDPRGPEAGFDPLEPQAAKRVMRGGSFLCNASYCTGYRVAARMKCTPDTGLMHVGFRCVKDGP